MVDQLEKYHRNKNCTYNVDGGTKLSDYQIGESLLQNSKNRAPKLQSCLS